MAATRRLNELTDAALNRVRLPGGEMTVAVSGGADSAALAHLSVRAGFTTRAVHVNHGFPASDMLADAAAAIAHGLDLPLQTVRVDVPKGPSPEEGARDARYQVLEEIDGPVLTAHTRDDSVETVLINLIRGTGLEGLGGIPVFRTPNIHRPLLGVTRNETREIATLANLGFVDDPMNQDLSLTRNRVRWRLLPVLREFNPTVEEAISRAAAAVRAEIDHIDDTSPEIDLGGDMATAVLVALPRPVATRVLRRWLAAHEVAVSADIVDRVWSVASGETPRQDLNGGRTVVRREALLVIE
jgi:tRNA(Ile)-lysidine synthase